MLRNTAVVVTVALLGVIAFYALQNDAEAYDCSTWYNLAMDAYDTYLHYKQMYGEEHWITQFYWDHYQLLWGRYLACGGGG